MTKPKPKFICPECNRGFGLAQVLGAHRRMAHGVVGTSPSAVKVQRDKALHPPPPVSLQCPHCDFKAQNKAGLTIHRKVQHGDASQSATAVAIRASDPLQCPNCEFHAHNGGGLKLHLRKKHNVYDAPEQKGLSLEQTQVIPAIATTSNGHHIHQETFVAPRIPEATLALALGRHQELCRSIATEHDLPPRSFAAELARLIYATTLR